MQRTLSKESPSKEQRIAEYKKKIEELQNNIAFIDKIKDDIDGSYRKHEEERLNKNVAAIDARLLEFEKFNERQIFGMLGERRGYINVLSLKKIVEMRPKIEEQVQLIKEELKKLNGTGK